MSQTPHVVMRASKHTNMGLGVFKEEKGEHGQ